MDYGVNPRLVKHSEESFGRFFFVDMNSRVVNEEQEREERLGYNQHNYFFTEAANYSRYALPFIKNIDRMLPEKDTDVEFKEV